MAAPPASPAPYGQFDAHHPQPYYGPTPDPFYGYGPPPAAPAGTWPPNYPPQPMMGYPGYYPPPGAPVFGGAYAPPQHHLPPTTQPIPAPSMPPANPPPQQPPVQQQPQPQPPAAPPSQGAPPPTSAGAAAVDSSTISEVKQMMNGKLTREFEALQSQREQTQYRQQQIQQLRVQLEQEERQLDAAMAERLQQERQTKEQFQHHLRSLADDYQNLQRAQRAAEEQYNRQHAQAQATLEKLGSSSAGLIPPVVPVSTVDVTPHPTTSIPPPTSTATTPYTYPPSSSFSSPLLAPLPIATIDQVRQRARDMMAHTPISPLYGRDGREAWFEWFCEVELNLSPANVCRMTIQDLCSSLKHKGARIPNTLLALLRPGWEQRCPWILPLVASSPGGSAGHPPGVGVASQDGFRSPSAVPAPLTSPPSAVPSHSYAPTGGFASTNATSGAAGGGYSHVGDIKFAQQQVYQQQQQQPQPPSHQQPHSQQQGVPSNATSSWVTPATNNGTSYSAVPPANNTTTAGWAGSAAPMSTSTGTKLGWNSGQDAAPTSRYANSAVPQRAFESRQPQQHPSQTAVWGRQPPYENPNLRRAAEEELYRGTSAGAAGWEEQDDYQFDDGYEYEEEQYAPQAAPTRRTSRQSYPAATKRQATSRAYAQEAQETDDYSADRLLADSNRRRAVSSRRR